MSRCEVCGGRDFRREEVEEVFHVDGRYVLVEHLLATVCVQCGEKTFDPEAGEAIRRRLHPVRLQGDKGGFRASFAEARGRKAGLVPRWSRAAAPATPEASVWAAAGEQKAAVVALRAAGARQQAMAASFFSSGARRREQMAWLSSAIAKR